MDSLEKRLNKLNFDGKYLDLCTCYVAPSKMGRPILCPGGCLDIY
ncbi:hypothetical protein EGR_10640 [Echinococcus granulosus]|uniref:Uncharacterized protein n=1 Tax=Echinococcus granulosus TaxID=6210 RepID=W6ULZ5_ECHGR|nr:hypothetical protein EGR_10640 [Echinococcus granulosus]EUB54504.1 hypothetical protein EGR_10640 [Echinococcus granulosus]